jgi:hypothetical protein
MVWHRDLALMYTVEGDPPLRVLAVGWLGFFTLRRGATPLRFQELLGQLCRRYPPRTATPGFHPCLLGTCLWRWWVRRRFGFVAGNGEIIVPGRGGKVYRAPTLIAHYVREHRYKPPKEFVEAVLALYRSTGLDWEAVERFAGDLGPDR